MYQLDLVQGCTAEPPIPNDLCMDGQLLGGGDTKPLAIPFDLSGGTEYTDATFDCLMPPSVLGNMLNDIWYDWVAPGDGAATIETCDHSLFPEGQPNTTMIVYEGCDCPVTDARRIALSDFISKMTSVITQMRNTVSSTAKKDTPPPSTSRTIRKASSARTIARISRFDIVSIRIADALMAVLTATRGPLMNILA